MQNLEESDPAPARDWSYRPGATVLQRPGFRVRRYQPGDRSLLRKICCDTGFLGQPVDPLFQDRELFADYLTGYFTDREPESTFVVEVNDVVSGYIMGCRHRDRMRAHEIPQAIRLLLKGGWRLLRGKYNRSSRAFVWWVLTRGRRETPPAPKDWALFHINLLPPARSLHHSRMLFDAFLFYLRDSGVAGVFGQMSSNDGRRGPALFERYGFRVLGVRPVSKYRGLQTEPVLLCTIARELAGFRGLAQNRKVREVAG